jgi:mono/diheme cytochrome c family protein
VPTPQPLDPAPTLPGTPRTLRRVGGRALLLVALPLAGACSSDPDAAAASVSAQSTAPTASAVRANAARSLYETNCSACHGPGGHGDGPLASTLPVRPANIIEHLGDHAPEEIVRRVAEGIPPAMPAAPLSTEEIQQVLNYIWSTLPDSTQSRLRALQLLMMEEH